MSLGEISPADTIKLTEFKLEEVLAKTFQDFNHPINYNNSNPSIK